MRHNIVFARNFQNTIKLLMQSNIQNWILKFDICCIISFRFYLDGIPSSLQQKLFANWLLNHHRLQLLRCVCHFCDIFRMAFLGVCTKKESLRVDYSIILGCSCPFAFQPIQSWLEPNSNYQTFKFESWIKAYSSAIPIHSRHHWMSWISKCKVTLTLIHVLQQILQSSQEFVSYTIKLMPTTTLQPSTSSICGCPL